ncbi:short-chain dehydrogenase [Coniophora puteana RWD-64-598 SS2]|uniref:Short-chain dehydrogenase n=1 Tax=Coniophora puteana (strain RWD-64-598) TaxID=741705 RepID=A0A5M3ML46_CONPW|nr:short-chain dehydrogenase [Coniophora puteana RWD-64-598 SS2]EIW79737.1 short-chain dehydrogenase [Coniophora puteana RWD-64-598 SS2]
MGQAIKPAMTTLASFDLSNNVALVTGGGSGIGKMIATGLADAGARVYITSRNTDGRLEETTNEYKGKGQIIPISMDVTDKDSITKVKHELERREGKLHILVNNAGASGPQSDFLNQPTPRAQHSASFLGPALFAAESFEEWSYVYSINTFSLYFVTVAFLDLLDKGTKDLEARGQLHSASVINITSISGQIKLAQRHFGYNSSKAAASHLTKMLSTEFAVKGIRVRVNAISPGVYESRMTHDTIAGRAATDAVGMGIESIPEGRPGTGEEMAGTAVYLASSAAGYMNGQELIIDGGYLAVNPSRV